MKPKVIYEIRTLDGWRRVTKAWIEPSGWLGYRLPNGDIAVVPPKDFRIVPIAKEKEKAHG